MSFFFKVRFIAESFSFIRPRFKKNSFLNLLSLQLGIFIKTMSIRFYWAWRRFGFQWSHWIFSIAKLQNPTRISSDTFSLGLFRISTKKNRFLLGHDKIFPCTFRGTIISQKIGNISGYLDKYKWKFKSWKSCRSKGAWRGNRWPPMETEKSDEMAEIEARTERSRKQRNYKDDAAIDARVR